MPTKEPLVEVAVCCAPDGTVTFTLADQTSINTESQKWLDSLTAEQRLLHKERHTQGGVVVLRMIPEDWHILEKRLSHDN